MELELEPLQDALDVFSLVKVISTFPSTQYLRLHSTAKALQGSVYSIGMLATAPIPKTGKGLEGDIFVDRESLKRFIGSLSGDKKVRMDNADQSLKVRYSNASATIPVAADIPIPEMKPGTKWEALKGVNHSDLFLAAQYAGVGVDAMSWTRCVYIGEKFLYATESRVAVRLPSKVKGVLVLDGEFLSMISKFSGVEISTGPKGAARADFGEGRYLYHTGPRVDKPEDHISSMERSVFSNKAETSLTFSVESLVEKLEQFSRWTTPRQEVRFQVKADSKTAVCDTVSSATAPLFADRLQLGEAAKDAVQGVFIVEQVLPFLKHLQARDAATVVYEKAGDLNYLKSEETDATLVFAGERE